MTSFIDRMGDSLARWLDGNVLETRQSSGFGLTVPTYQLDQPRWLDSNIGNYRKAFASQVAVYACVLARARGVSSAPIKVYQEVKGDPTELPAHPLRLLMQRPNPMMSEAEFLVMTQTLMDATGFAAIEKVRAGAGNVVELWHLRSDWLQEVHRRQEPSDWKYHVPGNKPVMLKAEDVLIIPGGPATDLGSVGMSPIAVALREVGIDTALTDFLKIFVDGGGTPRQALVTPNAVKDQAEADLLRGLFQQTYGGFRNWVKVALLSGGLDVKTIGSNIDEMAYPQLRSLTEAHICSVFGVPPIIAGVQAGLDAATYSNYAQARRAFFEDTIESLWYRLDGAFTRGLLTEFTDDQSISLEFDKSSVPALQEDKDKVWTRATASLTGGGITLNQYQAALGLPGFGDAGDVLLLPLNLQPIRPDELAILADQTVEPPQPMPVLGDGGSGDGTDASTGEPADTGTDSDADSVAGRSTAADGRTGASAERPASGNGRVRGPGYVGAGGAGTGATRIRTLPLETRARIATTNRRNVNRIASKFTPRLRALFRKQGERVAATATRSWGGIDHEAVATLIHQNMIVPGTNEAAALEDICAYYEVRDLLDIPWDELDAEMLRELNGLYAASGKLAFDSTATSLGVDIAWDLANPYVRQTMRRLAQRVVGINETTRQDVARIVTEGLDDGLSIAKIAENLQGLYTETYRNRSVAIARTESQISYNTATADAYRESGIVRAMICHDNPAHVEDYGAEDGLSCAERDQLITDVDDVQLHIFSEHPNGSLAVSPLLVTPLGEE